jgi:hypothetical protein
MPRTRHLCSDLMREQAASDARLARSAAIVAMPFAGRHVSRGSRLYSDADGSLDGFDRSSCHILSRMGGNGLYREGRFGNQRGGKAMRDNTSR